MEQEQYIAALEISSSKIVGAIATYSKIGGISVVAIEEEKLVDCVRYGVIQNIEEANTRVSRIMRKLENRSKVSPRKIQSVFVGVQGRSLRNIVTSASCKFDEPQVIAQENIETLRKQCLQERFEGFEVVDVVPQKYLIDKTEQVKPIGVLGSSLEVSFNLIVAKSQLKANLKRLMEKQVVRAKDYIVTPLSVAENVLTEAERQLGCMLVDFGAETTTVSIYKNDSLRYLATIPLGSRNISKDLTMLNILEENAENIKKTVGNAVIQSGDAPVNIDGVSSADVNNYIAARSGEIVANIMAQLEYADCSVADIPAGMVIVGGGSKLKGFIELLAQQCKGKVREGKFVESVDLFDTKAQGMEYIAVVSLLASGAKMMSPKESCCSEIVVHTGPETSSSDNTSGTPVDGGDINEEKPKKQKKPKKPSAIKLWIQKLQQSATSVFEEEDDEDDDNNDEK